MSKSEWMKSERKNLGGREYLKKKLIERGMSRRGALRMLSFIKLLFRNSLPPMFFPSLFIHGDLLTHQALSIELDLGCENHHDLTVRR